MILFIGWTRKFMFFHKMVLKKTWKNFFGQPSTSLFALSPASRFFYPPHKTGSSVQFSSSVVFDSLRPYGLQHTRLPCSSPTPRTYSNSCPLSQWCHTAISSSVVPFSFHLQSFPASGSSDQSVLHIRWPKYWSSSSASILPMNIQYWFPLRWTGS